MGDAVIALGVTSVGIIVELSTIRSRLRSHQEILRTPILTALLAI